MLSPSKEQITRFKEKAIGKISKQVRLVYVIADFSAKPTQVCPDKNSGIAYVQFTDKSTGPVFRRLWYFGDGTYSHYKNPTHGYTSGGSYTVTLTVWDESNLNMTDDSETKKNYITVDPLCLH